MLRFSIALLVFSILISGCASVSPPAPAPTPTRLPSAAPYPSSPAPTPTTHFSLIPLDDTEATPAPTRLPPTGTAIPEILLTKPARERTPTPAQALSPTSTRPAEFVLDDQLPKIQSPGGKWWYQDSLDPRKGVSFISQDRKVSWEINLAKDAPVYTAHYALVRWSLDENFAYFHYSQVWGNDGSGPFYGNYGYLKRIDLSSGEITSVVDFGSLANRGPAEPYWDYAFSPDLAYLAYIPPGEPLVAVLVNMSTGQKLRYFFDPAFWAAGKISWAPNSRELLINAAKRSAANPLSSIFHLKIEAGQLTAREVLSLPGYLWHRAWKGDQVLVFNQTGDLRDAGDYLYLYLSSQQVFAVTVTPAR